MKVRLLSESRYASLFRQRLDGAALVAADGTLIEVNEALAALLGIDAENLEGTPLLEMLPDDAQAVTRVAFAQAMLGTGQCVELPYADSSGERIPLEVQFIPSETDGAVFLVVRDLRTARLYEGMLFRDHERFRSLFEYNPDPVLLIDLAGTVDRVNATCEDLLRVGCEQLIGKPWTDILPADARDEAEELFSRTLGGEVTALESAVLPGDGERPLPVRITHIPIWIEGEVLGTSTIVRNITSERIAYDHMRRLAFHDALTGLPNRALFEDRFEQMLANAKRYNRPFALLCIDLDGFKAVNDGFGHPAGDAVLRGVADRLTEYLRESDTFARLGGDEFSVLQPVVNVPSDVEALAQKLLDAIREPFPVKETAHTVGLSIGIAVYPWHGADQRSLLAAADRALYDAKSAGKGTYRLASPI